MHQYQAPPDLLKNRVILVTGAGDGIGRAVALGFARHGATVVLLGRNTRQLERVYDEIENAGFAQPAIYPLNLEGASPKDYADLAAVIEQEFGCLHGLLHNAAVLEGLTPIANYNVDIWYKVLQVNLNAPFLRRRHKMNAMPARCAKASVCGRLYPKIRACNTHNAPPFFLQ